MISFTNEEIEANRLESLDGLQSTNDNGTTDIGYDPDHYADGSYDSYVALDRSCTVMETVETLLMNHLSILLDPEAYRLAYDAHTTLFNLYQHLGSKHLGSAEGS